MEEANQVRPASIVEPASPPLPLYRAPETEEELREWVTGRSHRPTQTAEEQPE